MNLIDEARSRADAAGFAYSCSEGTVEILGRLVASLPEEARVGELGTGYGVGTAAMAAALPCRARVITVEADSLRAQHSRELFADDDRVQVLTGSEQALLASSPFDFVFLDGGPKPTPDLVLALLRVGGVAVIDDFTPSENPDAPQFDGRPDEVRLAYLDTPSLGCTELAASEHEVVVVLTRLL